MEFLDDFICSITCEEYYSESCWEYARDHFDEENEVYED